MKGPPSHSNMGLSFSRNLTSILNALIVPYRYLQFTKRVLLPNSVLFQMLRFAYKFCRQIPQKPDGIGQK